MPTSLRQQFASLRRRRKMLQREAAEAVGVNPSMMSHFESGRNQLSPDKMETLAAALNARVMLVPLEDVDGVSGDPDIEEIVSLLRSRSDRLPPEVRRAIRVMVETVTGG